MDSRHHPDTEPASSTCPSRSAAASEVASAGRIPHIHRQSGRDPTPDAVSLQSLQYAENLNPVQPQPAPAPVPTGYGGMRGGE